MKADSDEEPTPPTIILNVRYPEAYPDVAPMLDITQPPNAPRQQHLDIQEDKTRLLDALQPTIEENMGIAMVFSLVSTLKDAAELLIAERQQAVQAQKDFESQMAEEEENRKFEGEKVTRESFLAWRESFRHEMDEERARKAAGPHFEPREDGAQQSRRLKRKRKEEGSWKRRS